MNRPVTVEEIVSATSEAFGVPIDAIMNKGRLQRPVARARQSAMWLTARLTRLTFEEIGEAFGRDRTTVRFGCETIDSAMASDAQLADRLDRLRCAFAGDDMAAAGQPVPAPTPAVLKHVLGQLDLALAALDDGATVSARRCIADALAKLRAPGAAGDDPRGSH